MNAISLVLTLLLWADPAKPSAEALEKLQEVHQAEASKWHMYLDEQRKTEAKLREKPIYLWTNPTRSGTQHGAVYIWMSAGRPVAIGSTFSHPEQGKRMLCHEFHSLATGKLFPAREAGESWAPKSGVALHSLADADKPAESRSKRLLQMRAISREFSAYSIDFRKERWELRLLPQPLYRYEEPEKDVIDGALFAFVTSAGTDPEVVLAIEARQTKDGPQWHYSAVRFSDSNLHVSHGGTEIYSSVRDDKNQLHFNPDHTYRLIRDRYLEVDPLPLPSELEK
jgi:hypothetical protein